MVSQTLLHLASLISKLRIEERAGALSPDVITCTISRINLKVLGSQAEPKSVQPE
jgi:hypothetical protein